MTIAADANGDSAVEQVVLDLFIESSLALVIAWTTALIAVALTMYEVYRHLQYYNLPLLQRQIVRVVLMVPIYAVGSAWSLSMPQWSIYLATVRDIYEAYVIHCFLQVGTRCLSLHLYILTWTIAGGVL